MALKKSVLTNFGVEAEYWRVARIELTLINNVVNVSIFGYLNENSRKANKNPLGELVYSFSADAFKEDGDNAVKKVYLLLKEKPEWVNAVDV